MEQNLDKNMPATEKIVNEEVTIAISGDKMEAMGVFTPANTLGAELSFEELIKRLAAMGVKCDAVKAALYDVWQNREYGKKLVLAQGKRPVSGKDGYIKYLFDVNERNGAPKILEDGRVDYHELSNFESVSGGTVLAEIIPPIAGEEGENLLGEKVPCKPGKPAPRTVTGKNVAVSADGTQIISAIGGQIVVERGRVSVSPVLNISSDVGNETGSIRFEGTVTIRGAVRAGFLVQATEDIEVTGAVEGAQIIAGGNIKLLGGVQGNGKAVINAAGNLFTKFAQNATLIAKGDITADLLMHCTVRCNGVLKLEGRTRQIVGGSAAAGVYIRAKEIGSSMATATELFVGNLPEMLEKYARMKAEMVKKREEFNKVTQIVDALMKLQQASPLPPDRQEMLLKSLQTKVAYRSEITQLEADINAVALELSPDKGVVYGEDIIRPGVTVQIGSARMSVQDEIQASALRNREGRVVIGPL